ncbi:MAG TPA: phenylalanine--tRNA ligase subunit beta [Dissulfurispiraceae bacterium]|nr:phenylalanine--tRNA ligase subunit beta [Dissulfurispiraceae bacterium]
MKVSFDWLKDFVKIEASAESAADRLTMIGLEVEGLERIGGDVVLEVNVTPNRSDCLSIIGVARELSAAYGVPLTFPDLNVVSEAKELDFNVEILEPDLCRRYAGRIVRNVKVGPSPSWMKERLEKCGVRSINNVVDITNYVLLEFGHPLHAFDLSTLKGHLIRVGTPKAAARKPGIKFVTLDGSERDISEEMLLIWDAERPVAVAGIMGGRDTEVTEKTVDIFIESAHFEPSSIRRTARILGLKTESSFRFERGADVKVLKKALDRAARLMKEIAGGTMYGKIDIYPKRFHPKEVGVRYARVNKILGVELSGPEILDCLKGLGLEIFDCSAGGFKVKVPPFRGDISREEDIIEEVARLYGYDNLPAELPRASLVADHRKEDTSARRTRGEIRASLIKCGFTEAINLSFMGGRELDVLAIAADDPRRRHVEVRNPLREEEAFMRTTLLPALMKNLLHNIAHGNRELSMFEMGKVFAGIDGDPLPAEREHVAAVYYREKTKALYKDGTPDFFIVKGIVDAVLEGAGIKEVSYVRSNEPFLHPGRSADIIVGGTRVGYIGTFSPAALEALDIKAQKPSVIVFEIELESILPFINRDIAYKPLPRYPFVERDTAIIVGAGLEAAEVIRLLKAYPSDTIEDVSIFDVYQGGNIAEGKKSIAFNVRYRSAERTLTDGEVEALHKSLVEYMLEKTDGRLRI